MTNAKTSSKLFYRIEEVSRLTKVDKATIENWEKEFPFLQPGWTGSGRKIFRPKDVEIIVRIKALLEEKNFTLAGARRQIEDEMGLRNAAPVHPDKLKKTLLQVRDELEDMARKLGGTGKKS